MPIIELSDGHGNISPLGPMKLFAIMLHPDNEDHRKQFLTSAALGKALAVATDRDPDFPSTPVGVLRTLHRSPDPRSIEKLAGLHGSYGRLAGDILLRVLSFAEYEPRYATLRRALAVACRHAVRHKGMPASPSALKTLWKKFRSVAHLWAAARYDFEMEGRRRGGRSDFILPSRFPKFLAVAEKFRVLGERHRPPGGSRNSKTLAKRILDGDATWKPPPDLELPEVTLHLPRPTARLLKEMQEYRAEP
jgi:hypothetical protein